MARNFQATGGRGGLLLSNFSWRGRTMAKIVCDSTAAAMVKFTWVQPWSLGFVRYRSNALNKRLRSRVLAASMVSSTLLGAGGLLAPQFLMAQDKPSAAELLDRGSRLYDQKQYG